LANVKSKGKRGQSDCNPWMSKMSFCGRKLIVYVQIENDAMDEIGDSTIISALSGSFSLIHYETNALYRTPKSLLKCV
jgi:hypothetical protein